MTTPTTITRQLSPYRIHSTIQSFPQWRTVRRGGAKVRLPEQNVKVIWLTQKIVIWRKRENGRWWMRCDVCLENARTVYSSSRFWRGAFQSAQRHALDYHNVKL